MSKPNSSHTGKRRKSRGRSRRAPAPALTVEQREELTRLIGAKIADHDLFDRAMTHSSAVPGDAARLSNERLEFLGDRVLGLVIAGELIKRFETEREGGLAPRLNALVSRTTCARIAEEIGLGNFLLLDAAERARGGAARQSILANAMEALIGAIYLEGGMKASEAFVAKYWKAEFKQLSEAPQDPKSRLQEELQGKGQPAPVYRQVSREGPDHAPVFKVEVVATGEEPAVGEGASKQAAERAAARSMLNALGVDA